MRQALADGNNIAATAYKVKGSLCNSKGVFTGTSLVAIDMIRTFLKHSPETSEVVFAWDSSPSWRHDYYSEYKANRRDKKDDGFDFLAQKKQLQNILAYLGIPQISVDLMEADDIAGAWMTVSTHPITFISNDIDWLQVLQNPLHNIYRSLDKSFVTMDQFEERSKGCRTVAEFVSMYGISGQSKDNIPGLAGIGPVKALSYIRGEMKKGATKDKIDAWMADPQGYERSLTLSRLGAIPEQYSKGVIHETPPQFNREEVHQFLTYCEANARLAKFDDFIAPFERLEELRKERMNVRDSQTTGSDRSSEQ